MEKRPHIGIGIDSFAKLITGGYYYVDKTELIRELVPSGFEVTLFTRPRRFGKSLALSMLAEFFDITKKEQNAHLFDGLKISKYPEICRKYQNAYPVISLSFKDVQGENPETVLQKLRALIASLYQEVEDILLPDLKIKTQKSVFSHIESGKSTDAELAGSLRFLTQLLHRHYGISVIVLLDEYDVTPQKAFVNGSYDAILDPIRSIMSAVFKGNPSLKFGVVTGCLRIVKESIFTGMNNFYLNSVLTEGHPEHFGFTPEETEKLLTSCGLSGEIETVREWYDGYQFGDNEIYNPWSVLNFANQGMRKPETAALPYWMNTSGNDIFNYLIKFYDQDRKTRKEIKGLIEGGSITKKINEGLTFDDLDKDPELIWSILLFTGYLKTASSVKIINNESCYDLVLPNNEVRRILAGELTSWFSRKIRVSHLPDLAEKFLTGKEAEAAKEISDFMLLAVSLRDSDEAFYQGMLTTLMVPQNSEYELSDNLESGTGYPDITIEDRKRSIRAIIEIKKAVSPKSAADISPEEWDEKLDKAFETALDKAENQIRNRKYRFSSLSVHFDTQLAYAAAFCNKECRIRKVEL